MKNNDFKKMFFYIIITICIGSLPALFINFKDAYNSFKKPILSPPGIVFPIVWIILFILMAISIYRINKNNSLDMSSLKRLYFIQLIINALWTPIFFGLKNYLFAFIWLLLLLWLVIIMVKKFYYIDKVSTYLNIPYIIWLLFAGYLNFGVYLLN